MFEQTFLSEPSHRAIYIDGFVTQTDANASKTFVANRERAAASLNAWSRYSLSAAGLTGADFWFMEFTVLIFLCCEAAAIRAKEGPPFCCEGYVPLIRDTNRRSRT